MAFGGRDRVRLLASLQELPDSACAEPNDPIWTRRKSLTFTDNFYEATDIQFLAEAIAEFSSAGQNIRAIPLYLVSGELMVHTLSLLTYLGKRSLNGPVPLQMGIPANLTAHSGPK